jgi:ATP-dependent helicase/nuclease subunit B
MAVKTNRLQKLITGDYPALEAHFVEKVRNLTRADALSPLPVVVSSRLLGLHLSRHLAEHDLPHVNIRFVTLGDLAVLAVRPHLLRSGSTMIPPFASEVLMADIARALSSNGKFYFSKIADRDGFHSAMLSTICDLKEACLTPADLKTALKDVHVKGAVHIHKITDIIRIWEKYEAILGDLNWLDEYHVMEEAAGKVAGCSLIRRAQAILIYGFYDFNSLQRRLLTACMQIKDTFAFVPYEPSRVFDYVRPTLEWFRSRGFSQENAAAPREESAEGLTQFRQLLFSDCKRPGASQNAITIISCPGELREVREILRLVLDQCRSEDIGLHEVGILLRDPKRYTSLLREALEQLKIDLYMPEGRPLSDTRSGRSLLLLLDILTHNFSRRVVLEFITYAPIRTRRFSSKGRAAISASAWDAVSIVAGIVEGSDEWVSRLDRLYQTRTNVPDEDEPEGFRASVSLGDIASLRTFIKKLITMLGALKRTKTWAGKAEAALDALQYFVQADDHTEDVVRAVQELGRLDDLTSVPSESEFAQLVRKALESRSIRLGRFQRNGPAIVSLMAARGIPFKVVVLPGMVEKSFPPPVRQDAILLDHEREAINSTIAENRSGGIQLKARRRIEEERLLFRFACGAAQRRLLLSFPRLTIGTSRERLPSSFVLAVAEALTGKRADFDSLESLRGFVRIPLAQIAVREPGLALDHGEFDLAVALRELERESPKDLISIGHDSPFFANCLKLEASRWGKPFFTPYDGVVAGTEARKILQTKYTIVDRGVSPTRLETYAGCPFNYLLSVIMGIEPVVEPEYAQTISPLDRGTLVHMILWEFLTSLKAKRGRPIEVQQKDAGLLRKVAASRFNRFERTGVVGYPAMWELEKGNILFYLDDFLEEESGNIDYHPSYFEVRYGIKSPIPEESEISTEEAVPLPFGRRKVYLRGRIDRIDISGDDKRAKVIDYKTGKPYAKENDFQGGTTLQLPLYLHATEHILKHIQEKAEVLHAEYYHLSQRGKSRHIRFDAETLRAKRQELNNVLKTIADGIEAGLFFPAPGDGCDFCDFDLICGPYRQALFQLKCGDLKIRPFLRMRGELDQAAEPEDSNA